MFKRLLPLLGGFFIAVSVHAGANTTPVRENPIAYNRVGTAVTVSVSTSAWTKINSTTSAVQDRSGFKVSNPASNSSVIFLICHTATPAEAITVGAVEVGAGENPLIPCGSNLNLYGVSLGASAQNMHMWEVGQ